MGHIWLIILFTVALVVGEALKVAFIVSLCHRVRTGRWPTTKNEWKTIYETLRNLLKKAGF